MPEAAAPAPAAPPEGGGDGKPAGGKGLLGGPIGWIIVVAVVVAEAVFFIVLMQLRPEGGVVVKEGDAASEQVDIGNYNKYTVSIANLNYTVPVATGQSASLSMKITIVLGMTPDERLRKVEIQPMDWEKFVSAVKLMEDSLRDRLLEYVSQQTYAQLLSPTGKEKIKEMVKDYVNRELKKIKFDDKMDPALAQADRVTQVLIPEFFLQQ